MFRAVLLASVIYLLWVAGGIIPYSSDGVGKSIAKGGMLIVSVFLLFGWKFRRNVIIKVGAFLLVGLLIGFVALFRAGDLAFALDKIDGAILCSGLVAIFIKRANDRFGENCFHDAFLLWSGFILLLTLTYKIHYGFFDRGTRFFLNGPIVYGWIMGFSSLVAFSRWTEGRRFYHLAAFVVFSLALVWTESKGSVVAFVIAWSVYFSMSFGRNARRATLFLALLVCSYLIFSHIFPNALENSRFSTIGRALNGQLSSVDEGSVGSREVLAGIAWRDFLDSPIFGIGLGQFSFGDFHYPHNEHLEVFAELGVVIGMLHLGFVGVGFYRARTLVRCLIIMFAVASSFSGDISYFRFLYSFCLLAIISDNAHFGNDIYFDGVRANGGSGSITNSS